MNWTSNPSLRFFCNNETNEFFSDTEDRKDGNRIIELPEELWNARKATAEASKLFKAMQAHKDAKASLDVCKRNELARRADLYEAVFDKDELKGGMNAKVVELVDPDTGEILRYKFKANVPVTLSVDAEALELLRPSIPTQDFEKVFTKDFKIKKAAYDALPEQSQRFLASAVTLSEKAPTYSFELAQDDD